MFIKNDTITLRCAEPEDAEQILSIGCIDIFDYDGINQRAGLGILIDKAFRQQGYAKAALALCIEYLFKDVMLHQVYCSIDENNTESQQLFVGQGFELVGRRKDWLKTAEGWLDVLEYQFIRTQER